jgi:hypothetical protein
MSEIKIGDIFQTSWGYDQTNYDFIIVKEISKTGKTVTCQRAIAKVVGYEAQYDSLKPTIESFGLPFKMRVDNPKSEHFKGQVWLRGSYPFLSNFNDSWDDEQKQSWLRSKRRDSFSKVEEGRTYAQTNSMFGY